MRTFVSGRMFFPEGDVWCHLLSGPIFLPQGSPARGHLPPPRRPPVNRMTDMPLKTLPFVAVSNNRSGTTIDIADTSLTISEIVPFFVSITTVECPMHQNLKLSLWHSLEHLSHDLKFWPFCFEYFLICDTLFKPPPPHTWLFCTPVMDFDSAQYSIRNHSYHRRIDKNGHRNTGKHSYHQFFSLFASKFGG